MKFVRIGEARSVVFPVTSDNFHYPSVLQLVRASTPLCLGAGRSEDEKEDIASEVTLKLRDKVVRGQDIKELSFVYTSIRNHLKDQIRKEVKVRGNAPKLLQRNDLHFDVITGVMYKKLPLTSVLDKACLSDEVIVLLKWAVPHAWLHSAPDSPTVVKLAEMAGVTECTFKSQIHRQREVVRQLGISGLTVDSLMRYTVRHYERNRKCWQKFPEHFQEEEFQPFRLLAQRIRNLIREENREREADRIARENEKKCIKMAEQRAKVQQQRAEAGLPPSRRGRPPKGNPKQVQGGEGNAGRATS